MSPGLSTSIDSLGVDCSHGERHLRGESSIELPTCPSVPGGRAEHSRVSFVSLPFSLLPLVLATCPTQAWRAVFIQGHVHATHSAPSLSPLSAALWDRGHIGPPSLLRTLCYSYALLTQRVSDTRCSTHVKCNQWAGSTYLCSFIYYKR